MLMYPQSMPPTSVGGGGGFGSVGSLTEQFSPPLSTVVDNSPDFTTAGFPFSFTLSLLSNNRDGGLDGLLEAEDNTDNGNSDGSLLLLPKSE